MRISGMNRWIGLFALAAFVAQGAAASTPQPDPLSHAAYDFWQLPVLAPDLPIGEVPVLVEADRLVETPVAVRDAALPAAPPSRGPPV